MEFFKVFNEAPAAAADLLAEVLTYWRETLAHDPAAPADPLPAKVATSARVFLLALTLTAAPAADHLTAETAPADVCEIYTADPLAEVAALTAAGLTVSHVTIKTTARELPAADVPALLTI